MVDILLRQSPFDLLERSAGGNAEVAPASQGALEFSLIDKLPAFEALADRWNALFDRHARPEHVFQSFGWCWHWARHYLARPGRSGPRLAIVAGHRDGRLVLVLPLVSERRAGLKQLSWLGEPVSQYGDFIAAPEASQIESLAAAWAFAVASTGADLANLRKVREDAIAAPLLARLGMTITATEEAPYLCFHRARDVESYRAGVPSKHRQKNRSRQLRRLQERGPVAFEIYTGTKEAATLATYAVLLKRAWLGRRDKISLALADDRFAAFFADVAESAANPVQCDVLVLRSCNEIAAMQIVLENKGIRFLHVAVYAAKFEKTGGGSLLLENSLANCYAGQVRCLDLLPPRHEYKMDFADGVTMIHDHALALSGLGRCYTHGYLGVRRRLKARIEAMPAPARRLLARAVTIAKGAR